MIALQALKGFTYAKRCAAEGTGQMGEALDIGPSITGQFSSGVGVWYRSTACPRWFAE